MKRTNLLLDELKELVRRIKARRILQLSGSGLWEGDLAEMRGDQRGATSRRKTRRRRGTAGHGIS